MSESAESAFHGKSGTTPYLRGGDEDDGDPGHAWTVRIGLDEVSAALRKAGRVLSPVHGLKVSSRSPSGRVRTVQLATKAGAKPLPAVELRQLLGYTRLPSLLFDVEVARGAAVFKGHGSGHGVGLCQWGARGRASRGEGYRQILAHYYPGAELRRMY